LKKLHRETERDRKMYTIKQLIDYIHTVEGGKVCLLHENLDKKDLVHNQDNIKLIRGYQDEGISHKWYVGYI